MPVARPRHFSNLVSGPILRFVQTTKGEVELERMLERAGDLPDRAALEDPGSWITYAEMQRLLAAAAEVLGGREGLRRACSQLDRRDRAEAFERLGSPDEVLRLIAEVSAKFSTVVNMEAVEVTDDHGVVTARSVAGFPRSDLMCAVTAGLLAQAADLFGLPEATVVEDRCETRGDDFCQFRVAWSNTETDPGRRRAQLELEVTGYRSRIQNLQATVAELVSGADVDTVLDRITSRATHAVTAHRYLLAVHDGDPASPISVHQCGFDPAEADLVARRLLAEEPTGNDGSRLVADVQSGSCHYGRLAAFNQDGVGFLPDDSQLFAAYARLAAAALDSATALETARRQTEVAHAMLGLGQALARVTTAEQAAQSLAEAVTRAVGCDMASVSLYDQTSGVLRTMGLHGFAEDVVDVLWAVEIREADAPKLKQIRDDPSPLLVERGDGEQYLDDLMELTGAHRVVIVPITSGSRLYGVVTAATRDETLELDPGLLERLAGLTDQAVTALQNAELLDAVRHQATHDSLTGTANQRLLAHHVELALRSARRDGSHVGMLFLDVDRFKAINDTLGHPAGDLALRHVAERICSAVRGDDVVARMGGDEFVVLLPRLVDPAEATMVAERVLRALEAPFHADDRRMPISASIGISVRAGDSASYGELLAAADGAMYRAKAAGGDAFCTEAA